MQATLRRDVHWADACCNRPLTATGDELLGLAGEVVEVMREAGGNPLTVMFRQGRWACIEAELVELRWSEAEIRARIDLWEREAGDVLDGALVRFLRGEMGRLVVLYGQD